VIDITLYEFNSLDEFEKGAALWEYGVHVTERFDEECGYSLYQLNDFYVEVKYNDGANEISRFTSFRNYTKLEPYLKNIDISQIGYF
jgi:hypothetical protein